MSNLAIGLLGALLATNQPQAVSNVVQQQTGISVSIPNPNDPEEQALRKVMEDDDAAMDQVDKWIRDNNAFAAQGAGEPRAELNKRIHARFDSVRKEYENFLKQYTNSARGHLAYGTFLNDIGDEAAAMDQYKKSSQLDPKNPAVWNNLANFYAEYSPVTNAFVDYAKAIELDPTEPVYFENLAVTVYLFRKDARAFYGINEQQVFDKALELYRKAMQLDPDNFSLATDYAESYYGIKPLRTNDALEAWTNTLKIAHNEAEREGVYIHLARIKMSVGRFAEAAAHLAAVTNAMYHDLKWRLERNLVERESETATNSATEGATTNAHNIPILQLTAPTNAAVIATNAIVVPTNPPPKMITRLPALTNPPPFSPKIATTMTNVPPIPPKPANLQVPPQRLSTNILSLGHED